MNSSHLAQLLRLRKRLIELDRKLMLCCVNDHLWSVMLVTGLDKLFTFAPDTMTALAGLQVDESESTGGGA